MFSVQQKRDISDAVQKVLRDTNHPELPETGEVTFTLNIVGAASWSFAEIKNNGAVGDPGMNPHNELIASMSPEKARDLIDRVVPPETPYMADPSDTPDTLMQEMLKQQIGTLTQRIYKAEAIIIDYNKRLKRMEDRDVIKDQLYSELRSGLDNLEEYLTPIMEDNLIQHHSDQLRNMMTAMKQLGNPQIQKSLEGD